MEGNRKPCLTQSTSWQSATTHLLSPTGYPFPLQKQEKSDSHAVPVSARQDLHLPISNELVPFQAEHFRDPTLMLFPFLKQENPDSNAIQVSARSDPHLPISNEIVPFQEVQFRDTSSLEYNPCNEVYNPGGNYTEEQENASVSEPIVVQESSFNALSMPRDTSKRVLPAVGAFTVQCARCFKWRLIPTKEQYEAIRQCILEDPWVCENAYPWRPDASCDDPADISQDKSRLWAIDKPNISQPPPGWERLLVIRGEGASKFADVYYVTPSGKKLRSMVEVERFLIENPEYLEAGVNLSQFSYQIPKPLYEGYVRKRSSSATSGVDVGPMKKTRTISDIERNLKATQAKPLSWRKPDSSSNLGMNSSIFENDHLEGSNYNQSVQPDLWRPFFPPFAKKKTVKSHKT